jgi:hypothetical protein
LVGYGNIAGFGPVLASANDLLVQGTPLLTYDSNPPQRDPDPDRRAEYAGSALEAVIHRDVPSPSATPGQNS